MLENESYSCTTLKLCIQRCDGPGRHEMLTIINTYYGYYENIASLLDFALI